MYTLNLYGLYIQNLFGMSNEEIRFMEHKNLRLFQSISYLCGEVLGQWWNFEAD